MQNKMLPFLEYLKNPTLVALSVTLLTTGFLRMQLFPGLTGTDDGFYTFASQWIFHSISQDITIKNSTLFLYQFITSWVYGLEINQILLLRVIDGFVAIGSSFVLFKVIAKESGNNIFTIFLMIPLLIIMNDMQYIGFGFRNSIWAAYLPLFSALLIWQNSSKETTFSFYIIGALVSLGILLREPLLPFFFLASIAIFIIYGFRSLIKFLIGSGILISIVLGFIMMFRGWDLQNLFYAYITHAQVVMSWEGAPGLTLVSGASLLMQKGWFVCIFAIASVVYLIKLYISDKKSVIVGRFYFWILVTLIPFIEPTIKLGYEYHYSICLPGLAGLSALGWKYFSLHKSRQIKKLSALFIGMISLFVVVPTVNSTIIKSERIYLPSDVIELLKTSNILRGSDAIERNQYSKIASKISENMKEDSTLAVSGMMQVLYPLTKLLPPTYDFSRSRLLHVKYNFDDNRLIETIRKYRPTLIVTTEWTPSEKKFSRIIDKIDIYKKVDNVPLNPTINYGWKSGTIYRLKDFN